MKDDSSDTPSESAVRKTTQEEDAEYYFLQLLFCTSRNTLKKMYRGLYDALFIEYLKIYKDGRRKKVSLGDIQDKFLNLVKYRGL